MGAFFKLALVATLIVVVRAQDAAFQQGLSLHNQQIQEHVRAEQEQQRQVQQFSASLPQQQPQQQYQQQQYQQQQQQPAQQYNQYQAQEDDGQYRAEYNNPNNFAAPTSNNIDPERAYQQGLQAHMQQIQEHLRKESSFQPQAYQAPGNTADPAYQQGLALHQRQIQQHLAQEQQQPQGGHVPHYQQAQAPQTYQHQGGVPQVPGIQLHQQQLAEHQRQEQDHQRSLGYQQQQYQPQQQQQQQGNPGFSNFLNFGGKRQ